RLQRPARRGAERLPPLVRRPRSSQRRHPHRLRPLGRPGPLARRRRHRPRHRLRLGPLPDRPPAGRPEDLSGAGGGGALRVDPLDPESPPRAYSGRTSHGDAMTDDAQPAPETKPEPKPEPVVEPAPAVEAAAAPVEPAPAAIQPEPPAPVPVKATKRPLVKRHHGIVRITHWLNAVLLLGMIASGLQIYGAFPHFGPRNGPYLPNPWDGKKFPESVRLGGWLAGGLNWHFALAWPFVAGGLAYLLYLITSGEWRSLLFRPRDIPRAIQMQLYYLRLRREHPPQGKHNALQKGAYSFIIFLAIISVLTG